MNPSSSPDDDLRAALARFAAPILSKSATQLVTTMGLFFAGCAAMYVVLPISYWLTLALAIPTGGLLVRIFIVQHDCGHGAFFVSRPANDAVGMLCSLMTLTPYANWRRRHAAHHGNWNNLDRRRLGTDLYSSCLTVKEYLALTRWRRVLYRLARHPLLANLLLPPIIFLMLHRLPLDRRRSSSSERRKVHGTNLAIAVLVVVAGLSLGFRDVLLVQLPIIVESAVIGVFLFTIQHRFEGTLWARRSQWSFTAAALGGSSYLRLPKVLHWFTGNIGFHHVHHLNSRVPNYRLRECHEAVPALRDVSPLTLRSCLPALWLGLWDEDRRRLVSFGELRARRAAGAQLPAGVSSP